MNSHDQPEQFRGFVLHMSKVMQPLTAPPPFLSNVEQYIHNFSLDGLRRAAREVVDWSNGLEGEQVIRVDAELTKAGLPTLTEMRVHYAHAGPLFALPIEFSSEERSLIARLISALNIKSTNIVDMEWNFKDRSLLDVYTGTYQGRRRGGGEVVTLRKTGESWEVVEVMVWYA